MSLTLSQAGSGNVKRVKLSDEATNSVQLATFQGWNLGDDIGYAKYVLDIQRKF